MSATIKTELKENSKEWKETLKKAFSEAGACAKSLEKNLESMTTELTDSEKAAKATAAAQDKLDDHFGRTNDAIIRQNRELSKMADEAYDAAKAAGTLADYNRDLQEALDDRKVKRYRDEINRLADEISGLNPKVSALQKGMSGLAAAAGPIGAAIAAVTASLVVMGKAGQVTLRAIEELSTRGSPAFVKLQGSINKVKEELFELADDQRVQKWASTASFVMRQLAEDAKSAGGQIVGMFDQAFNKAQDAMIDRLLNGQNPQLKEAAKHGLRLAQGVMAGADAAQAEQIRKLRDEALVDPGKEVREAKDRQDLLDSLATETDATEEINKLKEKQLKLVKELRDKGHDPAADKEAIKNARTLIDLEARRFELIKENRDKEREWDKKAFDRKLAEFQKAIDWEKELHKKKIDDAFEEQRIKDKLHDERVLADWARLDKLSGFLDQFNQAAGGNDPHLGGAGCNCDMMQMGGGMPGVGFNPMMGGQMPMGGMGWGGGWAPPGFGGGQPMGMGGMMPKGAMPMGIPPGVFAGAPKGKMPQGPLWKWLDVPVQGLDIVGEVGRGAGITPKKILDRMRKKAEDEALEKWREKMKDAGEMGQDNILMDPKEVAKFEVGDDRGRGRARAFVQWKNPRMRDGKDGKPMTVKRKRGVRNPETGKVEIIEEELPIIADDEDGGEPVFVGGKPTDVEQPRLTDQRARTKARERSVREKARREFEKQRRGKAGGLDVEKFADAQGELLKEGLDTVMLQGKLTLDQQGLAHDQVHRLIQLKHEIAVAQKEINMLRNLMNKAFQAKKQEAHENRGRGG